MKVVSIAGLVVIVAAAVWLRATEKGKKARAASQNHVATPVGPLAPEAQRASKAFAGLKTGHEVMKAPASSMPALHRPLKDPAFGTCIMRVTDPSQSKGQERIRHYYAKANPFNADNTRAILCGSDGSYFLYDTKTWKPIRNLQLTAGDAEVSWHPTNPNVFYHLDMIQTGEQRAIYRYDIAGEGKKQIRDFTEYLDARGKMEGNLDAKGRLYAMVGKKSKNENDLDAFVFDVEKNKVTARLGVTLRMVDDWISVTPSGKYVVMMGKDRTRVYDVNLKPVAELPPGSIGHADLCTAFDGRDLMVYDGADHQLDGNRNINVADLQTGKVSIGTRIGWKSTPHVSCRNLDLPGWALISTQGPDGKYPNHDFEIFWLKLDGSGEVRRVAHHHSDREEGGYFAEQHAVPNRDGTMILFASNWGAEKISDYLVDLRPGACGGQQQPPPPKP